MGGLMDTANFIKEKEDDYMYQDCKGKRIDRLYIRPNEAIELTSIGICSSITERARAYFSVTDFLSEKKIHTQAIELIQSKERLYSYYKLSSSVKIEKNHFYKFEVEIFGGATYTYTDTLEMSTHRDLMIEILRESTKKVLSLIDLGSEPVAMKKMQSTDEVPDVRIKKRRSTRKIKSQNTLDQEPEKNHGRRATMLFSSAMPQLDQQVRAKFKKMIYNLDDTTNMNLITGIVFRRPYQMNVCMNR